MITALKRAAHRFREAVVTGIYDELGKEPIGNVRKRALNVLGKSPLIPVSFADAAFSKHSLIKNSISTLAPDDVYLASYRVDPDAFIEALKWLERSVQTANAMNHYNPKVFSKVAS